LLSVTPCLDSLTFSREAKLVLFKNNIFKNDYKKCWHRIHNSNRERGGRLPRGGLRNPKTIARGRC